MASARVTGEPSSEVPRSEALSEGLADALRLPPEAEPSVVRALVVYGSRFGLTRRLAEALARGIRHAPGVEVDCRYIEDLAPHEVDSCDFLAVGAPTEILTAPESVRQFLTGLEAERLAGKLGFAFDTRLDSLLSGSAGKFIERRLRRLGIRIVRPHASALVKTMPLAERKREPHPYTPKYVRRVAHPIEPYRPRTEPVDVLAPGTEEEFERIGARIAATLSRSVGFDGP